MQIAAIAFARTVLGFEDANSYEFNPNSEHLIIHYMADQSDEQDLGGTMRLGAYPSSIHPGNTAVPRLWDNGNFRAPPAPL